MSLNHADRLNAYVNAVTTDLSAKVADLDRKAYAHDQAHNEGGYGYNPHVDGADKAARALYQAKIAATVEYLVANWAEIKAAWNDMIRENSAGGRVATKAVIEGYKAIGIDPSEAQSLMMQAKAKAEG